MRLLENLIFLLYITYSSAKLTTMANCGKSLVAKPRIVNGTRANFGDYPWIVSIQEKNLKGTFSHICGGAVLNDHWIVTAAHCFEANSTTPVVVPDYKAYVGVRSILKTDEKTVQKHELSKIIIHEDYDDDGFANDIALMKTKNPINFKGSAGYVNGICLPQGATTPSGSGTVIGWGKIRENGPLIEVLQEVTVPIVTWQTCKNIYGDEDSEFEELLVTPAMFCAGGNGKDTCQADSGGPFFQFDKKGIATLVGVVANGAGCAYKHYPGIYMKVSAYTNWMGKKMD